MTHRSCEVKITKQEIIEMIERAGFDPVERDTVYNVSLSFSLA
jgi:2-iminoacetate synthase ThiH